MSLVSGAWGYFDHHGDSVRWGGIVKGLTPLLPRVDRTLFTLVNDLEQRGLLQNTLVMMMGEFGRSPVINKDAGRDHWTNVMSLVMAGGGLTCWTSGRIDRLDVAARSAAAPSVLRTWRPQRFAISESTCRPTGRIPAVVRSRLWPKGADRSRSFCSRPTVVHCAVRNGA